MMYASSTTNTHVIANYWSLVLVPSVSVPNYGRTPVEWAHLDDCAGTNGCTKCTLRDPDTYRIHARTCAYTGHPPQNIV